MPSLDGLYSIVQWEPCTMRTSGGSCAVMLLYHIHPLLAVCSCLALIDVRHGWKPRTGTH